MKVPSSFDARDWTEAFNRMLAKNGTQPYNPDTLTTWFANALMRGYDEADKHSTARTREERDEDDTGPSR